MQFVKEKIGDIMVVRVDQERLDSNIAPELKTELLILVEQKIKKVLVDISKAYYADSSGLGALLFGLRQFRDSDGMLKIFGANARILNLIRIAQLESILVNFEDEQKAIESFQN